MPHLLIHTLEGGTKFDLDRKKIRIGRGRGNHLSIDVPELSKKHCEIRITDEGVLLRDLGSEAGTKVNGNPIDEVYLAPGDQCELAGVVRMTFVDEDADDPLTKEALAAGQPEPEPPGATMPVIEGLALKSVGQLATMGRDIGFDVDRLALVGSRGQTVHDAGARGASDMDSITLLRLLLYGCMRSGASDLHLEPRRGYGLLRMRIDGIMVDTLQIDGAQTNRLLGVVKVLCDIDITQRQKVQEGHFSVKSPDRHVDYRVSVTPSMFGQNLVIRVLDPNNAPRRLKQLGLAVKMYEAITGLLQRDTGMMLTTGPTGSGKTTTLYAALREIDAGARNIVSIENPVEYELEGVTQIPVDEKNGQTFNALLKSVLRQDPDVIVVGEVRDDETATTAMQAATTGHLVMSTMHTRDAVGAIFRLLTLGVEPYLIASSLDLVIAQRLVRRLCPDCKMQVDLNRMQQERFGKLLRPDQPIYGPVGCIKCLNTGYAGRIGVWEMMVINDALRDVILGKPSLSQIREAAGTVNYITLERFGCQLLALGKTSVEEVERVISMHG